MDKKLWIALILSMAVLFFYPYLIKWYYPQQAQPVAQQAPAGEYPATAPEAGAPAKDEPKPVDEVLTTVETPLFRAVLSSDGGAIKSLELKRYTQGMDDPTPVNVAEKVAVRNSFATRFDMAGAVESPSFTPSRRSVTVPEGGEATLVYSGTLSNGLAVEKKYSFSAGSYLIGAELKASNPTGIALSTRVDTVISAPVAGQDESSYHQGPITRTAKDLTRQDDDEPRLAGSGRLRWLGLEDKYFLAAVIPVTEAQFSWTTEVPSPGTSRATLHFPVNLAPNGASRTGYNVWLGPKEYDTLVDLKVNLEEAIEFGWFDWMAKPFLVVLNFFNKYIGNYGVAIIVLTVIIKVLFYPLTKKSLQSMRDMQKMQPQMAAIKERFKDDKNKMNKEMMELYKRNKINPVGGCLPMVLQIPVFIALYEVLYVAIELRHAPFFLWITDLSAKDPYYITPLLMGATMFIQQKMTPTAVDPAQQKIMLLMPVVFTVMFLSFPSGLVLYWLVNNVLSIGQQYFIYKTPAKA